jgi:hypothetical protein
MTSLDESRFRELLERHLEGRLSEAEAQELLGAVESDPSLRRRAAREAALSSVLSGILRRPPLAIAPRVLAALRNESEKTSLLRQVMQRLPDGLPAASCASGSRRALRIRVIAACAAAVALVAVSAAAYRILSTRPPAIVSPRTSPQDEVARQSPAPVPGERPERTREGAGIQPLRPAPAAPPVLIQVAPVDRRAVPAPPVEHEAPAAPPGLSPAPERPLEGPRRTYVALPPDETPAPVIPPATRMDTVIASLDSAGPGATVESGGALRPAERGLKLRTHDIVRTPPRSAADIRFTDGTRIDVAGDSVLILATTLEPSGARGVAVHPDAGHRVTLEKGMIDADIAAQPAGRSMLFATPLADIVITGTRIALWVSPDATRLEVRKGSVRLTRKADQTVVDVGAGQGVVAAPGQPLVVRPVGAPKPVLECVAHLFRGEVQLDREGALEWVHWSWSETVQTVRRKDAAPDVRIGPLTVLSASQLGGWTQSPVRLSWTDGRPQARGTSLPNGVRMTGAGNGFQFSLPAGKVARTLRLYVGLANAQGRLEAVLKDGSAPPVVDTSMSEEYGEVQYAAYVIRYAAASDGTPLTLRWTMQPSGGVARREARGVEEAGKAAERDVTKRDDVLAVLQAVTISDAVVVDPEGRKGRGD